MGANEKYEAAMHGGEHDFGSADPVSANRVRFMSEPELDRFIAKIKAEAKAEALDSLAQELVDVDMAGADEPIRAYDAAVWIRERANQYKEAPSA